MALRFRSLFVAALLTTVSACITTRTTSHPETPGGVIVASKPTEAWLLRQAGETQGAVVRFEEDASERFLYSVRDRFGLDAGIVDEQGRAWRFRPHEEPEWVHTGTVAECAARILEFEEPPRWDEIAPEELLTAFSGR